MSPASLPQRGGCECCGHFKGSLVGSHSFTFADGSTYTGEWVNGTVEGKGTYTWSSGTKYVGEFKAGVPHGEGELIFTNGTLYKGVLSEGQIGGGGGEVQFTSGLEGGKASSFEGGFEEAAANGRGVFRYPNSPAEGAWARGRFTNSNSVTSPTESKSSKGSKGRRPRSTEKGMTGVSAASFSLTQPDTPLNASMGSIKQRRSLTKGASEGQAQMQHEMACGAAAESFAQEPPLPPTPEASTSTGLLSSSGPLLLLRPDPSGDLDPPDQDSVDGPAVDQDLSTSAAEIDA